MIDFAARFKLALPFDHFLEKFGTPEHRARWTEIFNRFQPSEEQRGVLSGFVRDMNALCLAGAWCGDCVSQCPILEHFARASPRIFLRFIDRDADPELAAELRMCGGARVPIVVFLSEDFAECGRYGDRTLSRYRELAASMTGDTCPTRLNSRIGSMRVVADDWLREFERVQLMLRLSPRLRKLHGD